jgi:hypothetical protein
LTAARAALKAFNTALTDVERGQSLRQLQLSLPGCVEEAELRAIEDGVAIDCSKPNHCDSTCGSVLAYGYIPFFVVLTNCVVMKLVVPRMSYVLFRCHLCLISLA